MTQEEKELLLKDLCGRVPYKTYLHTDRTSGEAVILCCVYFDDTDGHADVIVNDGLSYEAEDVKSYLRPMSSMTEEEKKVVCSINMISDTELNDRLNYQRMYLQNYTIETFDYFNEHHLDYRGLIPMGLAIEAPKDMYNTKYL